MICIFCALYPEAQPLIKALALKQDKACNYYKKYINDENDICLYITGTGLINAAAAVGYALSENGSCLEKMHIVNFGCCALVKESGTKDLIKDDNSCENKACKQKVGLSDMPLYLCNKLVNTDSGRSFYPDMIYKSELDEAVIITGSKIYTTEESGDVSDDQNDSDIDGSNNTKDSNGVTTKIGCFANESLSPILYDMEAAAIYEAASHFVGPHQMHFLKFVTDKGDGRITADLVREKADEACPGAAAYIEKIRQLLNSGVYSEEEDTPDTLQLFEELHASVTMQWQIRQLLRYAKVAGIDYEPKLSKLRAEQILPCRDKRQGLKALEEIRDYITCC